MLHILYGTDWRANADVALDRLLSASGEEAPGLLIVPEQFSFDAERRLCERGGDPVSRLAEVLSFTRLYDRVCARYGGAATQIMDNSGRLIAMAGALEQVRSRLKLYGVHVAKPEFLLQLLALYEEFESCGVDRTQLLTAQQTLSGQLAEKLEELQLIFESYAAVCGGAAIDPATRLGRLSELLHEHEFAAGRPVLIDGFSDFTGQELDVIGVLLRTARDVTVCLCCDGLRQGQEVFAVPRETAGALRALARQNGVPVREERLPAAARAPAFALLRDELFGAGVQTVRQAAEITLCPAATPDDEARAALATIQRWVQSGACRWRDVAVACTDTARYRPVLERLFARYHIPAYFTGVRELLQTPEARMLLSALRAASGRMDAGDVLDYLKSGAAPIDADACDRLENYAQVWGLCGSLWEREFTHDPKGYADSAAPETYAEELALLNRAREAALAPLAALRRGLAQSADTGGQIRALYRFLDEIGLPERLAAQADALRAQGRLQQAQQTAQIYELLLGVMEQIYAVLGKTERTPEEFYAFFRAALSQQRVGTVPAALDCVRVGSLRDLRNSRAPRLLVLGADDGLLPAVAGRQGLLRRTERRLLTDAGLSLAPDEQNDLLRELLCAYTVLSAPSQALFVSAGTDAPSYLFTRLQALFPDSTRPVLQPLPVDAAQAAALLGDAQARKSPRAEVRQAAEALQSGAAYAPGSLSPECVRALYGGTLSLSASRFDKLASCKYAYFLRYGLKAEERRPARVDASLYGVFLHDVLEHTVQQVNAEGGFHSVPLERTLALAVRCMDDFVQHKLPGFDEQPARAQYLFRRSRDEVLDVVRELWEELRQSDFVPVATELRFAGPTAIPLQGRLARGAVRGYVDRVDLFSAPDGTCYARVVDYKSGVKDFDYTDLLQGVGLQMLIYLFALEQQGPALLGQQVEGAGVLYFPTRREELSNAKKLPPEKVEQERRLSYRRKGLLLDDETVLQAMEPCAGKPVYLPYSRGADGTRQGALATRAQLAQLRRYVADTMTELADRLCGGEIAPDPFSRGEHGSCEFCEFRTVCHVSGGKVPIRSLQKTDAAEFWARLTQKEASHG